jgi:small conductance mechanosensitive channel
MRKILTTFFFTSVLLLATTMIHAEEVSKVPEAVSTANPDISPKNLHLAVRHMTSDELFIEADEWLVLLKEAARKVYATKLLVEEENAQIDALSAKDNNKTATDVREKIKKDILAHSEEKSLLLEELTKLRAQRKTMVSRLNTILSNINDKVGTDATGNELEKVLPYRRYIDTVSGISLEVTDAHSAWTTVTGWVMSDEGGIYWLINIAKFLLIIFMAMFISKLLSKGARRALEHTPSNSKLLNDFISNIIHKVVMLIGLLVALSALDINVGPIMAMVGAAGFVVAFALQGTLSNFASGLMIMLYRPYDIGDVVDVAGIVGTVESMTLVSTSIVTPDNRMMIVPNNSIWGNIITNVTHSDTRRVDMTFGIGYNDNIEQAEKVMQKILVDNPLVLKDPAPAIAITELADSSVNFNCRPWVKTADYWTVYADVTRAVKEAFDKEGISIPYPQMDIHLDPVES